MDSYSFGRANEKKLEENFIKALKNPNFVKVANSLDISDKVKMKYTLHLLSVSSQLEICQKCKGLENCPYDIKGLVEYPVVEKDYIKFVYRKCKYREKHDKDLFYLKNIKYYKMSDELLKASFKNIYKDDSKYMCFTQESILGLLGNISNIMMIILGSIATISLVVGGIGIMNIMLVSVSERTREIGIRKAIGAKKKDILVQFLIEALMLTGIGGIIGILFGMAIIKFVIGSFDLITPVYSVPWIIASFTISLVIGVVFGIFPAYKAAKLNPIEALRSE